MTKLTLGPIAYHWSADKRRDFYARIADEAPVDEVYLGEVICSKRAPFHEADLPETIERLERAGKTVIVSTLAEVMLKRERKATQDIAAMDSPEIEVNNAAGLFARGKRAHRIGPFMNAYNEATIAWMAGQGATHVCLPAELPGAAIAVAAQAARDLGLGVEVQVFGRASLAVSARCYHARAHGRTKDNCQFVCEEDPDGMPLRTRDAQPILRVNGIQTQSESYLDLLPGGPVLRISQDRGPEARGCRLDADALETAVGHVAARLMAGADLLIINKFGKHEAEGRGFREVIASAVELDVPVLVGLNALNRDAFEAFSDGAAIEVAPDLTSLEAWAMSVVASELADI